MPENLAGALKPDHLQELFVIGSNAMNRFCQLLRHLAQ